MNFKINQKKKKHIGKIAGQEKKSIRLISTIERAFFVSAIGGSILYIVLNLVLPGKGMIRIRGVMQKNYFLIFMVGTMILATGLCLWLFIHVLYLNLASANVSERIEEKLLLQNNSLIYSYRIKYQSLPTQHAVITIPLEKIEKVVVEKRTEKVTIYGNISRDVNDSEFEDTDSNRNFGENDIVIIYDYFTPGLVHVLQENGVELGFS